MVPHPLLLHLSIFMSVDESRWFRGSCGFNNHLFCVLSSFNRFFHHLSSVKRDYILKSIDVDGHLLERRPHRAVRAELHRPQFFSRILCLSRFGFPVLSRRRFVDVHYNISLEYLILLDPAVKIRIVHTTGSAKLLSSFV